MITECPRSPAAEGFVMPAEWGEQEAVWLSWPVDPRLWPGRREAIEKIFARLVAGLSAWQEVRVNADPTHHAVIRRHLEEVGADLAAIRLFPHPSNDVWCRDHGPIFLTHPETGEKAVVDWKFNAWGGKFPPWDLDDAVPGRVAETLGMRLFRRRLVCEGGAIDVDGAGWVMTTESVLLNGNRNPGWDKRMVEQELRDCLGGKDILWLPSGLEGDDTDGHIDTLARFFAPGQVLAAVNTVPEDPDHAVLTRNRECLVAAGMEVVDLPQPEAIAAPAGWRAERLPATYANFLLVNGAVWVPTYGQARADDRACGMLGECFPGRRVVGFDCRELLVEGGAIHCLTQQQPA